jgi:hypothetical protein
MSTMPFLPGGAGTHKDYPDHRDAELVLRLYELRREPVMREARAVIFTQFLPRSYDDVKAVALNNAHPLNAAYRQTSTYWEMAYGMAKHGIVHPEFLAESTGEGLMLFAKVQPYLSQMRADSSPRTFQNAEWFVGNCELAKAIYTTMRARVEKMLAAK